MKKIYIINGPNLNRLSDRSASQYGEVTLEKINNRLEEKAHKAGVSCDFFQSNLEGEIIGKIHTMLDDKETYGLIVNPGAFTHYSIAIRDALEMLKLKEIPIIEVHLSNIHSREEFRHKTVTGEIATAIISGLRDYGYYSAIDYLIGKIDEDERFQDGE